MNSLRSSASSADRPGTFRLACLAAFLITLAILGHAALKPTSAIATLAWMPTGLGKWFERHDFIKNLAGFFWLGLTAYPAFVPRTFGADRFAILTIILWSLVTGFELSQMGKAQRVFDLLDILAGCLGCVAAGIVFLVLRRQTRSRRGAAGKGTRRRSAEAKPCVLTE